MPTRTRSAELAAALGHSLALHVDLPEPERSVVLDDLSRVALLEGSVTARPLTLDAPDRALLEAVVGGATVAEAAARVSLSRRTAFRRLEALRRRFGVESNSELVVRARGLRGAAELLIGRDRDRAALVALLGRIRHTRRSTGSAPSCDAPTSRESAGLLSARQREVLTLVGGGCTSREIAARLGVALSTVDSHVRTARRRLGARTRAQAAAQVGTNWG